MGVDEGLHLDDCVDVVLKIGLVAAVGLRMVRGRGGSGVTYRVVRAVWAPRDWWVGLDTSRTGDGMRRGAMDDGGWDLVEEG